MNPLMMKLYAGNAGPDGASTEGMMPGMMGQQGETTGPKVEEVD